MGVGGGGGEGVNNPGILPAMHIHSVKRGNGSPVSQPAK